jgi:hypothetical protein
MKLFQVLIGQNEFFKGFIELKSVVIEGIKKTKDQNCQFGIIIGVLLVQSMA